MTAFPTSKSSPRDNGPIRLWVIHDEEFPESLTSAEATCAYLARPGVQASIHFAVDADSAPDSVDLSRAAWHAAHGPTNACSIGEEHDGFAHQTREEWLDTTYGARTLERSAQLFATVGMGRYGIAPVRLTGKALRDCVFNRVGSGYCGHGDVTEAFGIQGGHTDPGPNFPYDWWETRARLFAGYTAQSEPPLEIGQSKMIDTLTLPGGPLKDCGVEFRPYLGGVCFRWQTIPGGEWTAFQFLGGVPVCPAPVDSVSARSYADGRLEVIAYNSQHTEWTFRAWQAEQGGVWHGWLGA